MKKIILLSLVVLFTAFGSIAQKKQRVIDPAKAQEIFNSRVKFMQDELLLTPEQTEKFIPVYKNYLETIKAIAHPKGNENVSTSDEAYKQIMNQLKFKRDIIDSQEKCVSGLKDILTPQQLMKFLKAEHKMQRKIHGAKEYRGKHPRDGKRGDGKRKTCAPHAQSQSVS